jgi:hypothetical protein
VVIVLLATFALVCGVTFVSSDEDQLAHVHLELLARDHQQTGIRPSPLPHPTGLDRSGVVGVDHDPRVDLELVIGAVARVRTVSRLGLAGQADAG